MRCVVVLVALGLPACGFHGQVGGDATPAAGSDATHAGADAAADATNPDVDGPRPIDGPPDAPPDAAPVAPAFTGTWLIPCATHFGGQDYCAAGDTASTIAVAGAAADHWHATVRIRGVMANNVYQNGTATATGWYAGGTAVASKYERFVLTVSSPPGTYYLNAGTPTTCCTHVFDYTADIDFDGAATLTLDAKAGDGFLWNNKDALTVGGVTTTPSPYDGQFAQLDLVTVAPR